MKTIDKDMMILVGFCLIFSIFLLFEDNNYVSAKENFMIVKENKKEMKVTVHRKDDVITLPINNYLIGVVGCEVDANYEMEALKTQAVVARTYALRKLSSGAKLTDDTTTQCFKDDNELKKKWGNYYDKYYRKIEKAIMDTDNLAIYYGDELIDAVYHSISNGYTEDAKEVWGSDIKYLVSVDSSWDKENKNYKSVVSKDKNDFLNLLGVNTPNYKILSKDKTGRVEKIEVGDKVFSGVEFRKILGLKSTDFEIDIDNDKINIITYGYGHGVGLSQDGANYMAKNGYDYIDIIKHYYKGVIIK